MAATLDRVWLETLFKVYTTGAEAAPRGMETLELLHHTVEVDMKWPVLTLSGRKLNYRFMAAEARWIIDGDDRVSTIAPYNPNIAKFSDDGITFAGAYGPPITEQIEYVVNMLATHSETRQAGLTIWRPNPKPSNDIPCTVAVWFTIRNGRLNAHVVMRSNDVWLGMPYDVFNMSMLAYTVCGVLRMSHGLVYEPGTLYHTAFSRHIYKRNADDAKTIIDNGNALFESNFGLRAPERLWQDPNGLMSTLQSLMGGTKGNPDAWWRTS